MKILILLLVLPVLVFAKGFGIATIVKGSPIVQNESGKQKPLTKGTKVFEADTIITSSNSLVRLVMMDTNIIDVYPNSRLLIKEYIYSPKENQKSVSLEVVEGRIKSTVKQKYDNDKNKYNVKTPVIVAGVRGTIFSAEHEIKSGISQVLTEEGNVMVGKIEANQQVKEYFSVSANQKISIDGQQSEKPKVEQIPKADMEKQKSEDRANGFAKNVINNGNEKEKSGLLAPPIDIGGTVNKEVGQKDKQGRGGPTGGEKDSSTGKHVRGEGVISEVGSATSTNGVTPAQSLPTMGTGAFLIESGTSAAAPLLDLIKPPSTETYTPPVFIQPEYIPDGGVAPAE